MEETIFDSNHPVDVQIESEPIVPFSPELEQEIAAGEIVKVVEPKRTIHCDQCGKDINCKSEKFDKRILMLHQRNKRLCANAIKVENKTETTPNTL